MPTPPPCYSDSSFRLPVCNAQGKSPRPTNCPNSPSIISLIFRLWWERTGEPWGVCSLRLRVSRSQNTYPQAVWSERTSGSSLEVWAERVIWLCSDSKPMDPWCVEPVASSFWFVPWLRRPFDLEEWVRSVEREWMLGPSLDHRTSSLLLRLSPPHRPRR